MTSDDIKTSVMVSILEAAVRGATKKRMMDEISPLSDEELRRISAELVDRGLLRYIEPEGVYVTTDKGHVFLNGHKTLKMKS
jgi:predicted transcriptional regulator